MTNDTRADVGVIGMAVMGRNLALNINDHGFKVAVFNREPTLTERAVTESGGTLIATSSLADLVGRLTRPRKILMMIKAGAAIDQVMGNLQPLLDAGDIVIDGGNSWYEDTQRREKAFAAHGLHFVGAGVSGGEDGARNGPSIMPGGTKEAYAELRPILEAIAARTDSGSCVTHVGPDGAGHFVKMVHNGIEYADMQLIAEAYDLLQRIGGLKPDQLSEVFAEWNRGPLESFLIEITSKVFSVRDRDGSGFLVDAVLDQAGQKGTGQWTARVALELGVAVPSIAAAIDARVLSSMKADRVRAAALLHGPVAAPAATDTAALVNRVHDALYAAKIVAYAQGLELIGRASRKFAWGIDIGEMARIWKGGCIIRARFLDDIRRAFERNPQLPHLLLDEAFGETVHRRQAAWREVLCLAQQRGIPVPGLSSSLAYFDSYRAENLPQNLTQAQRDAFGSHTYQRRDDPDGPFVHTDWLK